MKSRPPPLLAVFLLSGAALAYEILLTRLFAIVWWHHFAYLIISVALLGIGASGTLIVFVYPALKRRFTIPFAISAISFALTAVAGFAFAAEVPFNPLEIVWDLSQQGYLLAVTLLITVPFLCAGTGIGLTLRRFPTRIGSIYRADLAGAGLGAIVAIALLFLLSPARCLLIIGAIGLVAAAAALRSGRRRKSAAILIAASLAAAIAFPTAWVEPRPSMYKGLSARLNVPDARIVAERASPLGWLAVVESPEIPLRHAPGLSMAARSPIPRQLGVFTDGDSMTAITRLEGEIAALDFLGQQTAALPYQIAGRESALVLGAGGGAGVLRALYNGTAHVDAVELNPQMARLVGGRFADFSGHLYDRPDVNLHIEEARSFLQGSDRQWDVIEVALIQSANAAAAGVQALNESPLYTTEAMALMLDRLTPDGVLAITRWLRVPPRDSLKLIATASEVLAAGGASHPGDHVAVIRDWSTATILVKATPFEGPELSRIRAFAESRRFDLAWLPHMSPEEANRYNRLDEAMVFRGASALLAGNRDAFIADYKFHIAPATDDSPYFFRFFRWALVPELAALGQSGAFTLLDSGYLVLVIALGEALLASLVLILLPLLWLRQPREQPEALSKSRVVLFFLALGLAFMFVEIAFLQRLTLFLGHPVSAVAVVLAAFLLFAGLGSGISRRLRRRLGRPAIAVSVTALIAIAVAYLILWPIGFAALVALPLGIKVMVAIAVIAPLAFTMGLPFPLGLTRLASDAPQLLPWAWAVNGCASVVGAVLATLLAMHLGFTIVISLALVLYAVAALTLTAKSARKSG